MAAMDAHATAQPLAELTTLGRTRLSQHFFMREMLYSEVAAVLGLVNRPEDPRMAVEAGRRLAAEVLEPLRLAFGHLTLRSAYRSPTVNAACHRLHRQGVADAWCACNAETHAIHIWDRRDDQGRMGAAATVVIPGYLDHYGRTGDWRPLGWWIRDHVPGYAQVEFFRAQCAFNIGWREGPNDQSIGYLDPPARERLTTRGEAGFDGDHSAFYRHVIPQS